MSQWSVRDPDIATVLEELNRLYEQWRASGPGPFCPFSDPLWLQTCEVLRDAGLPWLNNNLHLPDEIDPSWPFQSKHFEREAVIAKGARVGDENLSGYICNWSEGNLYAIRALQQELRHQRPLRKPLLVANHMDPEILRAAAEAFGLEIYRIDDDWVGALEELEAITGGERPIIFAATWANDQGQSDDFRAIKRLSKVIPTILHVDASRNFNFVTSLPGSSRRQLGIPQLILQYPRLDDSHVTDQGMTIHAATIVAAGMNSTYPPPVVVLKPRNLGSSVPQKVEYLKGSDNTLCGSRDAIGPLLTYVQEQRFGYSRHRDIFGRCLDNRQYLISKLIDRKVPYKTSATSLDVLLYPVEMANNAVMSKLGLLPLGNGGYITTIQPSVTTIHLDILITVLCSEALRREDSSQLRLVHPPDYLVPENLSEDLLSIVNHWHHSARSSGGYCLNQATYSALGPVIGRFLPLSIPPDWARVNGQDILDNRKESFGLTGTERNMFTARFTTGSTMGNRIGLHAALSYHPNASIYFSTSTHYSVRKIVSDNDILTGRWSIDHRPRFVEILADKLGRMIPEELVKQVARDRAICHFSAQTHEIILLVNIGTTFTGGRDDVFALRQALLGIGSKVSYIHADGALDFGFSSYPVCLGKPDIMTKDDLPVFQGITLSHHKAFGIMVSGEVIYYDPKGPTLVSAASDVEPRVIFETWVFQKMYSLADLARMSEYCHENAQRLRKGLEGVGVVTCCNVDSIITLMERPTAWITHQFQLAPEGGWVHYITMPHISSSAVDEFIETMAAFERTFSTALHKIEASLSATIGEQVTIPRLRCTDSRSFHKVFTFCQNVCRDTHATLREPKMFELKSFEQRFAYGGTFFVALDPSGEPLCAFLSTSRLESSIDSWPVLMRGGSPCQVDRAETLRTECLTYLSETLDITVAKIDW